MKLIPLRKTKLLNSIDVIRTVATEPSPGRGVAADEMRKRVRILDKLEDAKDELFLEDADHAVLAQLIVVYQFGSSHREILQVIDDVIGAKEPPA